MMKGQDLDKDILRPRKAPRKDSFIDDWDVWK